MLLTRYTELINKQDIGLDFKEHSFTLAFFVSYFTSLCLSFLDYK